MAYFKTIVFVMLGISINSMAYAQLSIGSSASMNIGAGTVLSYDGLVMTPSASYTLSNTTLTRASSITHPSTTPSISRVYKFSTTPAAYSGALQMSYTTGELGSIPESNLQLNYHNGTKWNVAIGTLNTTAKTYAVSGLSLVSLSEITLANSDAPLPLQLLTFTGAPDGPASLLQWTMASGSKTALFRVEHSVDARQWQTIGEQVTSSTSNDNRYAFHHNSPSTGANYYRLLLEDNDGSTGYSATVMIAFDLAGMTFNAWPNPSSGSISVAAPSAGIIAVINASGYRMTEQEVPAGNSVIDIQTLPTGTYWLTFAGGTIVQTIKVNKL